MQKQPFVDFLQKKVFLKISQISQESTWLESLFNKVVDLRPATLLKKSLQHIFSCENCEIFKNTFFHRTTLLAACENVMKISDKSLCIA